MNQRSVAVDVGHVLSSIRESVIMRELAELRLAVEKLSAAVDGRKEEKLFYTLGEVATILKISERQFRDLRAEGVLPKPIRELGHPHYSVEMLDRARQTLNLRAGLR